METLHKLREILGVSSANDMVLALYDNKYPLAVCEEFLLSDFMLIKLMDDFIENYLKLLAMFEDEKQAFMLSWDNLLKAQAEMWKSIQAQEQMLKDQRVAEQAAQFKTSLANKLPNIIFALHKKLEAVQQQKTKVIGDMATIMSVILSSSHFCLDKQITPSHLLGLGPTPRDILKSAISDVHAALPPQGFSEAEMRAQYYKKAVEKFDLAASKDDRLPAHRPEFLKECDALITRMHEEPTIKDDFVKYTALKQSLRNMEAIESTLITAKQDAENYNKYTQSPEFNNLSAHDQVKSMAVINASLDKIDGFMESLSLSEAGEDNLHQYRN